MKLIYVGIILFILLYGQSVQAYTDPLGIEPGDIVDLDYEGRFTNGTVFDAGRIEEADISPGRFIIGFYEGVLGMTVGETKEITVAPEDGYTSPTHFLFNKTSIFTVHINGIPVDVNPEPGETISSVAGDESDDGFISLSFTFVLLGLMVAIPIMKWYR